MEDTRKEVVGVWGGGEEDGRLGGDGWSEWVELVCRMSGCGEWVE